jgi:tRNA (adenine37-N6)-methyltransferase
MPRAGLLADIRMAEHRTSSRVNPLGIKFMGESGCMASLGALVKAVIDALPPLGIHDIDIPLTACESMGRSRRRAGRSRRDRASGGMRMIKCTPIGIVRSPVTKMSQGNWAEVESEIHLEPQYAAGLQGVEEFSHVIVLFYLHQATGFDPATQLLRRPRGMAHLREVGVFAQRTKYRPNPIGVTSVALKAIRGGVLTVSGLDALDGTPVLDLKPYMPVFDRVENAHMPEWVVHFMEGYF